MTPRPRTQDVDYRLVLWNIGLTLVDAARVDRAAYAEAFRATTGRLLIRLPQMAGRTDSEIFFEALAVNAAGPQPGDPAAEELLGRSAAGELRDAGADLVLDDLADTEAVLAAVDRLTVPVRS